MTYRIDVEDARLFKSIMDGVKNKRTEEILRQDRQYWYEMSSKLKAATENINWQYNYTR